MNKKLAMPSFLFFLLLEATGYSQSFFNLDFEGATINRDPSSPYAPYAVYSSSALPGWTAYISGVSQNEIIYDTVPLAAPEVTLQDHNGFRQPPQGNYAVMLWGPFNPSENPAEHNTVAIGQAARIPLSSMSIEFFGDMGGMQITFDGQPLNFVTLSTGSDYNVYGADVSAFAGQAGVLMFTDPWYSNTHGGPGFIDSISFLSTAVPEPRTITFVALAAGLAATSRLLHKRPQFP